MPKIEKQNLPVFFAADEEPIAVLMFIKRQRVVYMLKPATEDEVIGIYAPINSQQNAIQEEKD